MNIIDIEAGTVIHSPQNETSILTIVSLASSSVGIALSAAALVLLVLTAILFTEWRQNYKNQLLIQFMASRFLYTFVRYFHDIRTILNWYRYYETTLYVDVFWMVYTETALVFWMLVFSKQIYDSLVKVFVVENKKLWKVSSVAWLVPCVISIMTMLLIYKHENSFNIYLFYTFFMKWPVLVANAVLLILALKSVLKNNKSNPENNVRIILVMIVLIFIFCFQQVLLDCYKIMFVLILHKYTLSSQVLVSGNILSLYHCALSITFWVFGNANTRKMWKGVFKGFRIKRRPESRCLPNNA